MTVTVHDKVRTADHTVDSDSHLRLKFNWEQLYLHIDEIVPGQVGMIEGRLRFWDNSLLEFTEAIAMHTMILAKTRYAYHYQNDKEQLIFRYDNAPHHPAIKTFPHHKHVMNLVNQIETIEPATAPHLNDVLREID